MTERQDRTKVLGRLSPRRSLDAGFGLLLLVLVLGATGCGDQATAPANGPPTGEPVPFDHLLAPGASANDILSDERFDRLVVQVQYVEGFQPTAQGLALLESFLEARLNKSGGIEIQLDDPLRIERQEVYSAQDVRRLEAEHRTAFTEGATLATYVLFLDGEYSESPNVLGIAHNNTSTAVFIETIRRHSGGPLQPTHARVEATVAIHEFGHILGLVNNGSAMQTDHQDEPNGRHCDDGNCLMYYAVRTTDFISNLLGGMPDLDPRCIEDLQANGGR